MTEAAAKESPSILVVEDEVLIRMVIADYLRRCGYKVIEAAGADEAVAVLGREDVVLDVVLSDVEMPGTMDGFALARWIRARRPGLPVVLVGSPQRAAEAAGDLCENGPMLAKPYDPQLAANRIKQLLAAHAARANS